MASLNPFTPGLDSLPPEVLENVAFYYICPRLLGPPASLAPLLLTSRAVSQKLSNAKHMYARVFKYKFSFSAIRRRGFEPKPAEWMWQLRRWCEILWGVRKKRRRPNGEEYLDSGQYSEEPGVQETMYALWLMCLEDDGCNRLQMQLAGVYEWVEGYVRTGMYSVVDKGWPTPSISNSCAMAVFWYLSSKARLLEELPVNRELITENVFPFLTVPFRYPTAYAPANHFRVPLHLPPDASTPNTPFSIPTPHGPYPIYLDPSQNTVPFPHFDRWTPLTIPLASDAAKLVYFSRRETMQYPVPTMLPRNREDHRERVRQRLIAEANGASVVEFEVETAFRSELPRPTQEDFMEMNEGLLGGEMVEPLSTTTATAPSPPSTSTSSRSPYWSKGGGTALPCAYDRWDDVRRALPSLLVPLPSPASPLSSSSWPSSSSSSLSFSDADLDAAERIFFGPDGDSRGRTEEPAGTGVDETLSSSRRWDTDWWRLRSCRESWDRTVPSTGSDHNAEDNQHQEYGEKHLIDDGTGNDDNDGYEDKDEDDEEMTGASEGDGRAGAGASRTTSTSSASWFWEDENGNECSPTLLNGYPQRGPLYTPGTLNGLWTGRMMIPSEPHLRALLLPPELPISTPALDGVLQQQNTDPAPLDPDVDNENEATTVSGNDELGEGEVASNSNLGGDGEGVISDSASASQQITGHESESNQETDGGDPTAQAGYRPDPFNEDTLQLFSVPLYVRLREYAVFSGGRTVPCAADTEDDDGEVEVEEEDAGGEAGADASRSGDSIGQGGEGRGSELTGEDTFDQGISNAWFPHNTSLQMNGNKLTVSVPAKSLPPPRQRRGRRKREEGKDQEYEYVAIDSESLARDIDAGDGDGVENGDDEGTGGNGHTLRRKRGPGTFHDKTTCPGCRARQDALKVLRSDDTSSQTPSSLSSSDDPDLPPYIPSPSTIPLCTGIRDILVTGSTDPRHANAWGNWTWKGRVRKWDGLIGLVREQAGEGPPYGMSTASGGKLFFSGTLVGGRNFIGTWRMAYEDPRLPAWEGAFTLGRKDE
ncbi:hypothetical protein D9757_014426 [Collybiopsis confluens]|uniref:F-box domain-containing protein n=1 Tax=Collybiopsis confluens TaxID=2823264 RepID=A0A8H5FQS3_9AGAR|nr:hypothetical protein D9757_014426 [Collybiopsis confluens]